MERFLRSNNFARVLAVFLAVILWLFVTGDKITRTTPTRKVWQDVPLRIENLYQDYVVTEIPPSVNVTLEGFPDDFVDLPMQEIDTFVDLSGKEPGNHLIRVQGRPPRGLNLVMLEPEQVRVAIEAYSSMDFELKVEFIGEPANGWVLADYTLEPADVLVGAPQSIFEQVEQVLVVVDLTGRRLIDRLELTPTAFDAEGVPVSQLIIDPYEVTVILEFERVPAPEIDIEPVPDEENGGEAGEDEGEGEKTEEESGGDNSGT